MPRPVLYSTATSLPREPLHPRVLDREHERRSRRPRRADTVAGSSPTCGRLSCTCSPEGMEGAGAETAIVDQGSSCLASVVGVDGLDRVARADVRQRAAAAHGELDRRARAGGLVGVRERDVRDAERRQRGGQLVGGGRAQRGRKGEVDLGDAERPQVGGDLGDRVAGRTGRRPARRRSSAWPRGGRAGGRPPRRLSAAMTLTPAARGGRRGRRRRRRRAARRRRPRRRRPRRRRRGARWPRSCRSRRRRRTRSCARSPPRSAITGMRRASAVRISFLIERGWANGRPWATASATMSLAERGAQAGGDEALLVRVGDVRALGAEALRATGSAQERSSGSRPRPAGSSQRGRDGLVDRARRPRSRPGSGCGP